jgi:hypothetical protein
MTHRQIHKFIRALLFYRRLSAFIGGRPLFFCQYRALPANRQVSKSDSAWFATLPWSQ